MAKKNQRVETKTLNGRVVECKERTRNGVRVGVLIGHIAAWAPDLGGMFSKPDQFHRGAFLKSIQEHKDRDMRPINLRDHHGRTVGGFPIDTVKEDDIGLYAEGEINLEVQQGAEAFSMAKQGVLTDFSIGFVPIRDDRSKPDVRDIFEAMIIEGSIVDEPMNQAARVLQVKGASVFQDLPVATQDRKFEESEAKERIEEWTGTEASLDEQHASRFLWHDETHPENLSAYRHPIADVVEGKIMAIPQAIFKAAAALLDGDGGVPTEDRPAVINHLERYYAKLGLPSPFSIDEKQFFGSAEVADLNRRSLERVLVQSGRFSSKAAKSLASSLREADSRYDGAVAQDILSNLRGMTKSL